MQSGPTSHSYISQRLRLHYDDWGNPDAPPLLLLHGGRDYQVTDADWQAWRAAFADDPRATLRHYPALNHIGVAGEAPSRPEEYLQAGRVDRALIDDAAAWIRERAGH